MPHGRVASRPGDDHEWLAATTILLNPTEVAGVARRLKYDIGVESDAIVSFPVEDVYCGRCRRPFAVARGLPCVGELAPHLKGGRRDAEDRDPADTKASSRRKPRRRAASRHDDVDTAA